LRFLAHLIDKMQISSTNRLVFDEFLINLSLQQTLKRMKKIFQLLFLFISIYSIAQDGYQKPVKILEDIALASPTPSISVNDKGDLMLIMEKSAMPTIADLAQPELKLAGLRINPNNNGQSRMSYSIGLKLKKLTDKSEMLIKGLPAELKASNIQWSPNDAKIAFCNYSTNKIELWVIDVATNSAKKLSDLAINAAIGSPFDWIDNQTIIAKTIPTNRGAVPKANPVPSGPTSQQSLGKKSNLPTFQDLLKNASDESLFEYYGNAQLVKISLNGTTQMVGKQGIYLNSEPSPDGKYLLTSQIHRPFSYLVTYGNFPRKIEIWNTNGNIAKTLVDLPLYDSQDWNQDAAKVGQRNHNWRDDVAAMVYWTEAQDEGNPKNKVEIRDKVFGLEAPFAGEAKVLYSAKNRFGGFAWGDDKMAFVSEYWNETRRVQTKIINPKDNSVISTLFDRSSEDRYNNPGQPEKKKNAFGREVLAIENGSVFMMGQGASPEGDRPFVDKLDLNTKQSTRLWRSEAPYFESVVKVLDAQNQLVLTNRQSNEEQPNFYIRDLKKKDGLTQITTFQNPYPMMKGVQKSILKYKRNDGVELSATLYLPAGYKKEDGALPTFMWAYPVEFKTKEAASQVSGSPYTFTRVGALSAIYWVMRGYAVMDNTAFPIVGEGDKEPNDTYVEQLVASAKAAIDEGVRLGVVDAERVGVGGHSYGAFMTANLLTHCNLFKAGIARSGAYNRTLTPFGFQAEKRTYWQAADVYNKMSPFMNADKMKTPLLMLHGEADNNTGTFPIQSERYYNALKGMGATVRLTTLPYESHGYAAKESVLHTVWEMDNWLETYVKNAKKKAETSVSGK
jgi:dipeptidyl aminopeptidase/acylaminoacyl peptidase